MAKYTIPDAAEKMGFTPAYVRSLIRKGQLLSELEPIVPESLVKRHHITDEGIAHFFDESSRKTHRADKRNKFVIYMTLVEYETVKILLTENGLSVVAETIKTWNPIKSAVGIVAAAKSKTKKAKKNAKTT